MFTKAVDLNAITDNINLFAADQLARLDPSKAKSARLPGKFAYFHGGSAYHRVAVVCPLDSKLGYEQLLTSGLIWANKVSNGQKTLLYLVGQRLAPEVGHLIKFFGPRVEIRLAHYTPKLNTPFLIAGKEQVSVPPRYAVSLPRDQEFWERKFNPVEKGWFLAAIDYFRGLKDKGIEIAFLENWVSVKFHGLEIIRISIQANRLRIALITRYPKEVAGSGGREEREGWFNTEGLLNSDFILAFEQKLKQLSEDKELFSRVCSDKQFLEYLLVEQTKKWNMDPRVNCQLDVGYKNDTSLIIDILTRDAEGKVIVVTVHPQKDLMGLVHCLKQLLWAQLELKEISCTYFNNEFVDKPQGWIVCPESKIHSELETLQSLLLPQVKVKLLKVNDDFMECGLRDYRWCE